VGAKPELHKKPYCCLTLSPAWTGGCSGFVASMEFKSDQAKRHNATLFGLLHFIDKQDSADEIIR